MRFAGLLALLSVTQTVRGQGAGDGGLSAAIANNTDLSAFRQLLLSNQEAFNEILPSSGIGAITVLVPTNSAIQKFQAQVGMALTALPIDKLTAVLRYHVLAAKITNDNLTAAASGLAIPTLLRETLYNNRTPGPALIQQFGSDAAQGNVVFLSKDPLGTANKLRLRQSASTPASLRGGLASDASITTVDGVFGLGYYQIIDTILEPPAPCSNTIRSLRSSLAAIDAALNRTNLWAKLNTATNVTCLAPSDDAFAASGNPQNTLNETLLEDALLFHTLPQVTYSNYLQDGLVIQSLEGGNVRVSIVDDDVYFNDAKVVAPNVLTNNGLIHVLDKIMSPNGTAPSPTTTSPTTSTPSPSESGKNAGNRVSVGQNTWTAVFAFVMVAVLI